MSQGLECYSSEDELSSKWDDDTKLLNMIADWAVKHKMCYAAIEDLLLILRGQGFDLPSRAHTLISTYARQADDEFTRIECLEKLQTDRLTRVKRSRNE